MKNKLATTTLCLLLLGGVSVYGQGVPKMPSREEIDAKIKAALDGLPETTAAHEDGIVTFKYKSIPMDPKEVAELAGMGKNTPGVPKGVNVDGYIKQYGPMIQQKLNEYLANAGTVVVTKEFKLRSKTIPVGEHKFGLAFKGEKVAALIIFGEKIGKKVVVKLKAKKLGTPSAFVIKVVKDKKKPEERFNVLVAFGRWKGKGRSPFKIEAGK